MTSLGPVLRAADLDVDPELNVTVADLQLLTLLPSPLSAALCLILCDAGEETQDFIRAK